ncbi:MAG: serine/threonine protein kinase [Planctomycetales bacterium]|nr:serine/threonine protein kinase [Planctomycetales bacterium]
MGIFDKFKSAFGGSKDSEGSVKSNRKIVIDERFDRQRTAVSGTMSKFYAAFDRQRNCFVGLKLCDLEKFSFFESRFKGLKKPPEGEIAASMEHPNIVKTLEYGRTVDNEPYLVMEFIDGPGLQSLIHNRDEERLKGKRFELIRQMADALQYVHRKGYIHRDVCPRNFICSNDLNHIKLIDFGLTVPATEDFMKPGNRTGTPLYMAPEIVRRRATDQRVDIFAFGVTCYQLLTLELPWPGGEVSGLAALNHDSAARDIFEYLPDLDRTLGTTIMQCIKPNPKDRLQTIDQFMTALRQVDASKVG